MTDSVSSFVLKLIEKKAKLPESTDLNNLDYIETGYVDSIGIIKFIIDIEAEYDIEILDSDMESQEFRTVGGIISLIRRKIEQKNLN
jgi:acyl carrier protein